MLERAIALARKWAGADRLALIVSGSHAAGDAVWAPAAALARNSGPVALSDLDLYAVLPDARACDAARARARAWRRGPDLRGRLLEIGLGGALELSCLTPGDLARLPARPGTLALRRHGRVLDGDPAWTTRVPDWSPRDVSAEEILLLLENRAFELLLARADLGVANPLVALAARHATLKTALDLALVACVEAGELPEGGAARVARARRAGVSPEPPWDAALEWRGGHVVALAPDAARREWHGTAVAWLAAWLARVDRDAPMLVTELAVRAAARARPRRRLRQALTFHPRAGGGPGLFSRLRHTWQGTPQHRLNASAAVLVTAMVESEEAGTDGGPHAPWRTALDRLGVVRGDGDREAIARRLTRLWDLWICDGQRLGEGA